jgi:hypothetical protein
MLLPLWLVAQPVLDIGLHPAAAPNTLEVRVKANGTSFNGVVSALTFTIRWEDGPGAEPGPVDQNIDGNMCPLFRVGLAVDPEGTQVQGGFRYLTYNAFSFSTLASCPSQPGYSFPADVETVIARIPVTPGADCGRFAIINDAYTAAQNKDFYAELNGLDRTGTISTASTAVEIAGVVGDCDTDCSDGPIAGITAPAFGLAGAEVTFTATPAVAEQHSWDLGDGDLASGVEVTHSYALPGTYEVTLVVTDGPCSDATSTTFLVEQTTGLKPQGPATGARAWHDGERFVASMPGDCSGLLRAELFDAIGQLFWLGAAPCVDGIVTLPRCDAPSGIWLLRLKDGTRATTHRIAVQR